MKHIISYIILIIVFTFMWSCSKSDDNGSTTPVQVDEPTWNIDLSGSETAPTSWSTPSSGIYQFSMTAIIKLSDFLEDYADSGDMLSAFIGNDCRGIAKPQIVNGKSIFFLYIRGNSAETQKVSFKYYSAKNKITYTCANVVDFTQNATYGQASNPAVPPFEESGKYTATMKAVVLLNEPLPFELRSADLFAAFIGNECRGLATKSVVGGKTVYAFNILGKSDNEGAVYFKYYSHHTSAIYTATESFAFAKNGTSGSETAPFTLTLKAVTQ